jgi:hypothetical protein
MASDSSFPEKEALLARIRELEGQNGILQDKLDMIYAILASDYDEPGFADEEPNAHGLIQIQDLNQTGHKK